MKYRKGKLAGMAIGVLVLVSACGFFPKEQEQTLTLPQPPQVASSVTYPVTRGNIAQEVDGTSQVTPVREEDLYFLVGGRVQAVNVAPEDKVKKGQVLASLESGELEHQLALAKIDLQVAKLQRLEASTSSEIQQKLADLTVERQQENVNYLQKQVDNTKVTAPFDGIIRSVSIKVSDQVQEYQPVIDLSDPTKLEIQLQVSENDFEAIVPSMPAQVEYSDNKWVPAKIIQTIHLDPQFDPSVQTDEYLVNLRLVDSSLVLKPYYQLPVRIIERESKNTLLIPLAGLRQFNGRNYVRVLQGDVRREVDVKIGIQTATQVEILAGLKEGEKVIGQ